MQYDYGPGGGAYFLVCMVYLKAYSLTVAKITIAIVMIDAREYYKSINPLGLNENYSFAILSASVMNCHTSVESRGGSGVNILKIHCQPSTTKPGIK